jgi:hypothetical protein
MSIFPSKVNYTTGQVLTATEMNEIGEAINLLDSAQYAAGKNKIINGDFGVWQRGTSFTLPGTGAYTADRFRNSNATTDPISRTVTQQTFTPGTAPVAGYEGTYFWRSTLTTKGSCTGVRIQQRIEDVRTLAGQTATFSFWAKSDTSRVNTVEMSQFFGSGGSATVDFLTATNFTTTTAWQRFTFTVSIPGVAGKTIGTGSNLAPLIGQNNTDGSVLDLWGLQLEAGSTASNFQTATGTIQGELAACQRYYQKSYNQGVAVPTNSSFGGVFSGPGTLTATNGNYGFVHFPVVMRVAPTVTTYSYTSSTTSVISNATGTDQAAGSGVASGIGDAGFGIYNSAAAVTTTNGWLIHYAASAEL